MLVCVLVCLCVYVRVRACTRVYVRVRYYWGCGLWCGVISSSDTSASDVDRGLEQRVSEVHRVREPHCVTLSLSISLDRVRRWHFGALPSSPRENALLANAKAARSPGRLAVASGSGSAEPGMAGALPPIASERSGDSGSVSTWQRSWPVTLRAWASEVGVALDVRSLASCIVDARDRPPRFVRGTAASGWLFTIDGTLPEIDGREGVRRSAEPGPSKLQESWPVSEIALSKRVCGEWRRESSIDRRESVENRETVSPEWRSNFSSSESISLWLGPSVISGSASLPEFQETKTKENIKMWSVLWKRLTGYWKNTKFTHNS